MVVSEITTGDYSECTDGRERPRLRAAQRVLAIAVANDLAIEPTRQIEIPREHFSGVAIPAGPALLVPMARIGIGLVAWPTAMVGTSVIIASPLVAVARIVVAISVAHVRPQPVSIVTWKDDLKVNTRIKGVRYPQTEVPACGRRGDARRGKELSLAQSPSGLTRTNLPAPAATRTETTRQNGDARVNARNARAGVARHDAPIG
jgi:hypothetical protein